MARTTLLRVITALLVVLTSLVVLPSLASSPPNLEKTLATQQQLVTEQPYDSKIRNDLGNLLLLDGRYAEAEAAYRRAVELDAMNTGARFNLALLMQQSGRTEEAEAAFRELLEVDACHGWAHYQLGVLYQERGERTNAIEEYARAFACDPSLSFASNNPHIIDNRLSTEALLISKRYRTSSVVRVPRQYGDPQRIADLMLQTEESAPPETPAIAVEGAEETADDDATADRKAKRQQMLEQRARARAQALEKQTSGTQGEDSEGDDSEDDDSEDDDSEDEVGGGRRVLSSSTLGRPVESAGGDAPQGRGRRARTGAASEASPSDRSGSQVDRQDAVRQGRDASARSRARSERSQSSTRSQPAPSRPRYIPGRGSTGRLDLQLLPEEPAERHATLGSARG